MDNKITLETVWEAMKSDFSWSLRPLYWDTSMVPATDTPMPSVIMRNMGGKLSETAATAAAQSLPTQNMSMTLYNPCRKLLNIIGSDRKTMALIRLPSVISLRIRSIIVNKQESF